MRIAVIPARGGSKRIPRKNMKNFMGKPIIAWSIEVARKSQLFEKIIVSTDDEKIAEIANFYGASTPFLRPDNISDDYTTTNEVMSHSVKFAVDAYKEREITQVCCLYPTAPFINIRDLELGFNIINTGKWDYVFSATTLPSSVYRSFLKNEREQLEMLFPQNYNQRSQDLSDVFHDAAQFYWGTSEAWLEQRKIFDKKSTIVRIPRWRVQDIDTEEDWIRAEIFAPLILEKNL